MRTRLILFVCGLVLMSGCAYGVDPVAQWLLNDGQGTTIANEMPPYNGEPYTGKLYGNVVWVTDAPAQTGLQHCVDFGGTVNDYVALDNPGTLAPSAVTVAFWAKATGIHVGQAMMSKYWSVPGSFELGWGNNNNVYWRVWNSAGTSFNAGQLAANPFTNAMFNDGKWHFFAGTADAIGGARLYVDGVLIEALSMNDQAMRVTGNPLQIGRRSYPGSEAPYSGKMSCVSIYDTALTQPEIVELMNGSYGTLSGQVILSGYNIAGDESKRMAASLVVEFIQDGSVVARKKAEVDADGHFVTPAGTDVPNGTYDIAFVAPQFARKVITGMTIGGPTALAEPVTLVNGDADGDNQITSTDRSIVIQGMD